MLPESSIVILRKSYDPRPAWARQSQRRGGERAGKVRGQGEGRDGRDAAGAEEGSGEGSFAYTVLVGHKAAQDAGAVLEHRPGKVEWYVRHLTFSLN
jgi:hypothetical protein